MEQTARDEMILSVLVCSLAGRETLCERLLTQLQDPLSSRPPGVEVLIERDDGAMTVGAKRNLLLARARGRYVCFVDDDDEVARDYVMTVLDAVKDQPDVVELQGVLIAQDGRAPFVHSIRYVGWYNDAHTFYRTPNHLNPVRRDLALLVGFPEVDQGEDRDYSTRLRPLLTTEARTDHPIYYYHCPNLTLSREVP